MIPQSKNYRPEIDGLRAFAVIAVIINHFNREILPSGFLGVDIFFVISGYVITSSLANKEYTHFKDFLLGFYSRRLKRLMPGLIACITITSLLGFLLISPGSEEFIRTKETAIAALFGASNLYLFKESTDYFAASTEINLFTQTWSLGVEEQFYLVFPIIFWITGFAKSPSLGKRVFLFTMLLLSALSLFSFIWLNRVDATAAYFLMPSRFWELGVGCITLLIFQSRKIPLKLSKFVAPLPILLLIAYVIWIREIAIYKSTIEIVLLTALLIGTLNSSSIVYKLFTHKIVLWIGSISYSLYLWHWSILALSRWTIGIHWITLPIQLGSITILATLSYKYIEQPLRHAEWSRSRIRTITYGLSAPFIASLLLYGASNTYKNFFYSGVEAKPIKKGASTLKDENYWQDRVAWSGEKCALTTESDVGKDIKPELCTFGLPQDRGTRFLVIGNSFSAAEIEMYKVLALKNLGAVTVTSSWGASPIGSIPNNSPWRKANDYYWSTIIPKLLSQLKRGDVVIMINDIAGYAPAYQSQESTASTTSLQNGLSIFTKQLNQQGIGVIFQSVNPFMRETDCVPEVAITDLAVRKMTSVKDIGACRYYTKAYSLNRRRLVHDALTELENNNQNFKILDLFNTLCPDTECSYLALKNKVMYRDSASHLSAEGSIASQSELLKTVQELKLKMSQVKN
ncbi:acyltransferase family protein [Chamaesiphon sp. OTE_75_metabat_556]|uniref:acyltransferase family protein n=1 Tax=Chamaesiphon sp. OTE_75_metabat_556 TaxID=2964692 RepID=UPI00286A6FC2|nr:acyltransferase family protein [Chamaesiphon sp. OTE_75_metabat_556]